MSLNYNLKPLQQEFYHQLNILTYNQTRYDSSLEQTSPKPYK